MSKEFLSQDEVEEILDDLVSEPWMRNTNEVKNMAPLHSPQEYHFIEDILTGSKDPKISARRVAIHQMRVLMELMETELRLLEKIEYEHK